MTARSDSEQWRDARDEGIASVSLLVGGTFQGVTQYAEAAAADVVIYADVLSEVNGVPVRSDGNILTLRLAAGETLGTLTRDHCQPGLKRFLGERSGVNLNVGLGQLRAVGAIVAQQLLADPAFNEFTVKHVFERLLQLHNGCLEHIEVQVATSIAGGTGSAVGPALAKALAKVLLQFSNATVHIQTLRVGSLSFSGLGDRVHLNGAATLAEDVNYILDNDRHPREVRSMLLVENPMVGSQKARRDAFSLQLMQALRSHDVQAIFQRSSPNDALNSCFGTIYIVRAAFFHGLCDRRIAAEVARAYESQLDELLRTGMQAGIGDEITVKMAQEMVAQVPTPKELADQIRRAKGVLPPNLLADCLQAPVRFVCEKVFVSVHGQLRTHLRSLLTMPGASRAELTERLSVLKALQFKLQQHLQQRNPDLVKARKQFEAAESQVRGALSAFFPESWFDQLTAYFNNPQANLIQFQNLVRLARQFTQTLAKLQAENDGLQDALGLVASELAAEEKRIRRAMELLRAVAAPSTTAGLVRTASIDRILVPLLETAGKDFDELPESLFRLLGSCVSGVTMSGLAAVVGARETRANQVALALSRAQTATKAPAWGGKRHLGAKQRILVLPPMSPEDVQALRQLVGELDSDLVLAAGDSAQASVNAVLLEVYSPRHSEEIFTPFHLQHLRKACEEPDLYFTNGDTGSRWLESESVTDNNCAKGA